VKGVDSVALPEDGEGVPLVQLTLTETLAPLLGTKSLFTMNVPAFSVFVIVQDTLPPLTSVLLAQFAWFAV
jgi:hypothetical protein